MAIELISNTAAGTGANSAATSVINTTGATLLIVAVSYYTPGAVPTISDSKANTWQSVAPYVVGDIGVKLFYTTNPTVGESHTFNVAATGAYPSLAVSAFSGTGNVAYDVVNGGGAAAASAQPGNITPTAANDLIFTAVALRSGTVSSVSAGFTLLSSVDTSVSQGLGAACKVQAAAAAVNPTWAGTTSTNKAAIIIAFKATPFSIVTTSPLPNATVGVPFSYQLAASGGTAPYGWGIETGSSLPAGLSLSASGLISGTPTAAISAASFNVVLYDEVGAETLKTFTITVVAPLAITNNPQLPSAQTNESYSVQLTRTGSAAGTWSKVSGNLPAGALAAASGLISIPVVGSIDYSFTARFTETAGGAYVEKNFQIPVVQYASITFCHRRETPISEGLKIRFFKPISGSEQVIEDAAPKRVFTIDTLYITGIKGDELRQFLYAHRKRQPFLWLNPDRNNEALLVRRISEYTENPAFAAGRFEFTLEEV